LLDRFGRKLPLNVELVLFSVASVLCLFPSNVESLIAQRFVQALGGWLIMFHYRVRTRGERHIETFKGQLQDPGFFLTLS